MIYYYLGSEKMYLLLWLVFGGIAGWVASILTDNNKRMGVVSNIIIGLIGSALGGWIASLLNFGSFSVFSLTGMLIAIGGAVLLIFILNLFRKN